MIDLPTPQEYMDKLFRRHVERLADHLRYYAGQIESIGGEPLYDGRGRSVHVSRASDVLHVLNTMTGNASMIQQILISAADAQRESDTAATPDELVETLHILADPEAMAAIAEARAES